MGAAAGQHEPHQDHEVAAFLTAAGLQMYTERMVRSGFDDVETLLAMEDSDIKALGFTTQHAAVLRRKMQEHRGAIMDESHPVVAFLKEGGLGQYAESMLRNGWDDMDTLCMIDEVGMKELGLPRGHVVKLKKKLREYQEQSTGPLVVKTASTTTSAPSRASSAASSSTACSWDSSKAGSQGTPASSAGRSSTPQSPAGSVRFAPTAAESWEQVRQIGIATVAGRLYENILTLSPETVALFRDEQGALQPEALQRLFAKLVKHVGCAVGGEVDTGRLTQALARLGAMRVAASVGEEHWRVLGRVLDISLRELVGPTYTPEVRRAWMIAFEFMSSVMVDGFRSGSAPGGGREVRFWQPSASGAGDSD